jgi:aspartyl-tRNA(Asn)/glutamyl-tRNA(Gln) amidotransferase subunit A
MVGRANMDEFAMGSSTETSWYGVTKNPWDTSRVPGGSSGGSAAAVASGMVPWALGSDTGGSVRQPAAFCGITGLKPTYGSVSRYGLVAYASSLDQVGVFARDVYDTATVFSVIAGQDDKDASTLRTSAKDYTQHLDGKIPSGLRIGIIENAFDADGMDPEVQKMMYDVASEYEKMGAQITKIKMPSLDYAAACYFIISRAEAASNLARFDGVKYGYRAPEVKDLQEVYFKSRGQGFGKEVQLRIMVGNYVLTAGHAGKYYHNAKLVQQMMRQNFIDTFKDIDVLLMPTQAAPAFHFNAFAENKLQMDLQDYFTAGLNLAGVPGMSIPCGVTKENLPVGIQLIGTHGSEELLFKVGHAYQQVTDWHTKKPKI